MILQQIFLNWIFKRTQKTEWVKLQRTGLNTQNVIILQAGWRVNRTCVRVKLTPHKVFTTFKLGLFYKNV